MKLTDEKKAIRERLEEIEKERESLALHKTSRKKTLIN